MSTLKTTIHAGCKVNLYLKVLKRRSDGYHELVSLFLPLPKPHDTLTVTPLEAGSGLRFTCNDPALETKDNTVSKVCRLYAERTNRPLDIHIHLEKCIPSGAGLGGGSSDAAAVLAYLVSRQLGEDLSRSEITAMAAAVGADVPFFLQSKPAWVRGIGEKIEPVCVELSGMHLLLACPPVHVSTAWAYGAWDKSQQAAMLTSSLEESTNPRFQTGRHLSNSFESVVFERYPELRRLKQEILSQGASACVMSGSGASMCSLFRSRRAARDVMEYLDKHSTPSYLHAL